MTECMYPKCRKCNEGFLLPFFGKDGWNAYGCSHCGFTIRIKKEFTYFCHNCDYSGPRKTSKENKYVCPKCGTLLIGVTNVILGPPLYV